MRKLFLVDYRENGISKHQCLETECNKDIEDSSIIAVCHGYVGFGNELDGIAEILSDISAKELNDIASKPEFLYIPRRIVYVNPEELKRCARILNGSK